MIVHLNLHASEHFPIKLYEQTKKNQDVNIKVTNGESPVNVKILSHDSFSCERQGQYGHSFYADQYLTFEMNVDRIQTLFFNVEIYVLEECIGRAYLSDCYFTQSHGNFIVPLLNPTTSSISAEIRFDYLIIKRWRDEKLTDTPCVKVPTVNNNNPEFIYMGHRGCGKTTDRTLGHLENTIPSFCTAQSLGASYVELDVLLTKDLVPVVFHDHHASLQVAKKDGSHEQLASRVHDLTLDQVKTCKMDFARPDAGTNYNPETFGHLFPTLEEVITHTPSTLGLFIEIKYPTQEQVSNFRCSVNNTTFYDVPGEFASSNYTMPRHASSDIMIITELSKQWEATNYHDRNVLVDQILDVVSGCSGDKPIMFCSFDPECCILLNCKQDRFPVAFITSGENTCYATDMDIRYRTRKFAINFALMNDLMGVSFYGNPLMSDPEDFSCTVSLLKKFGKETFTWGTCNDNHKFVLYQKSLGVTGIISDRLENLSINVIGA